MKAITVFTLVIGRIRELLLREIKKEVEEISDEMITWVLTIPAIWSNAAKQFMRNAAVEVSLSINRSISFGFLDFWIFLEFYAH